MSDTITVRWRAWCDVDDEPDPGVSGYFETDVPGDFDHCQSACAALREAMHSDPERWDDSSYILEIVSPDSRAGRYTVAVDREPRLTAAFEQ